MGRRRVKDPDDKGKEEEGAIPEKADTPRAERIRRIKEQVRSGTYRVDSGAVADKLLDDAMEKIRSRSRVH